MAANLSSSLCRGGSSVSCCSELPLNFSFIKAFQYSGWGKIVLARSRKANAYNQQMLEEFEQVLLLWQRQELRALLIESELSRFFCAGADKDELRARSGEDAFELCVRRVWSKLHNWPGLTAALICGAARGGGLEMALACDLRIVSAEASLAFPELSLGLIPAAGGISRLVQLVGLGAAKDMILTGRLLSGQEAKNCGLAQYFAVDNQEAGLLAEKIVQKAAALDFNALRLAKMVCNAATCGAAGTDVQGALESASQAFLYEKRAQKLGKR
ncbi:MAG: enoyl-CoA hydratase/isomerase family protein [Candidatus Bruticola sp.]